MTDRDIYQLLTQLKEMEARWKEAEESRRAWVASAVSFADRLERAESVNRSLSAALEDLKAHYERNKMPLPKPKRARVLQLAH